MSPSGVRVGKSKMTRFCVFEVKTYEEIDYITGVKEDFKDFGSFSVEAGTSCTTFTAVESPSQSRSSHLSMGSKLKAPSHVVS